MCALSEHVVHKNTYCNSAGNFSLHSWQPMAALSSQIKQGCSPITPGTTGCKESMLQHCHNTCIYVQAYVVTPLRVLYLVYKHLAQGQGACKLDTVYVEYFMKAIIELVKINACKILRINPDSKIYAT